MLEVIPAGEQHYRLVDGTGRDVGWIRRRAVRFFGFTSKAAVMHAAVVAWRAMRNVLMQRGGGVSPRRDDLDELRVVHDGAYEWISDGRIPIARLYREAANPGSAGTFAVELIVPRDSVDESIVPVAHAIAAALIGTGDWQASPGLQ
jgi:hypothetical protein